jgi:hypothetical protein
MINTITKYLVSSCGHFLVYFGNSFCEHLPSEPRNLLTLYHSANISGKMGRQASAHMPSLIEIQWLPGGGVYIEEDSEATSGLSKRQPLSNRDAQPWESGR